MESRHNTRYTSGGLLDHQLAIRSRWTSENCLRRTCRQNFYRVTLCAMHSSYRICLTRHISETAWDRHILPLEQKKQEIASSIQWHHFNDLRWPTDKYTKFLSHDAMLAWYVLCDAPVLVRLSVLLGAEGPRDANSCRGTRRDVVVHAAYCYRRAAVAWSVHPCGLLLLGLWSNNRVTKVQSLPCLND